MASLQVVQVVTEVTSELVGTRVVELLVSGPQGVPGEGVPDGGTAGQVLVKQSATDYDTDWAAPADELLAFLQLAGGASDTSTTSATMAAIRPTGDARITFTVPSTGKVLVAVSMTLFAVGSGNARVRLFDQTNLVGNEQRIWGVGNGHNLLFFYLTGLTPASSVTVEPYFASAAGGTTSFRKGDVDNLLISVWKAP